MQMTMVIMRRMADLNMTTDFIVVKENMSLHQKV